jgi:hypothetical protein
LATFRHDVSWGTKGSDKADALPSVSSKKGKDDSPAVVEDIEKVQEDIDAAFQETVDRAVKKLIIKEEVEQPTMDVRDFPIFRSPVVLNISCRTRTERLEPALWHSGC